MSKAGWAVSGLITLGRATPRVGRGVLAVGEHGVQMLPVPPVVTRPTGSLPLTASAWSRSSVMAMISDSNRVALGHMSRCSTLTWENRPKASFMKS